MGHQVVGERIEQRRKQMGLTLDDIAQELGVARSTIQRYEKGTIDRVKLPIIEAIARVIAVNPAWLCGKTDDMTPEKTPAPESNRSDRKKELMAAFWGGEKDLSPEDMDEMWADVENFAAFVAQKKRMEKQK